jgi:hypothetical protein
MARESKILTVSYGAFACTLEGFDDPFTAMKAVAEYFRDLAAEDRQFGAHPHEIDPALLERLATADESNSAPAQDLSDHAQTTPAEGDAPDLDVTEGSDPAQDIPPEAEADPQPAVQEAIPEGVAARLARLRQMLSAPAVTEAPDTTLDDIGDAALADALAEASPEDAFDAGSAGADLDDPAPQDLHDHLKSLLHDPEQPTEAVAADPAGSDGPDTQSDEDAALAGMISHAASLPVAEAASDPVDNLIPDPLQDDAETDGFDATAEDLAPPQDTLSAPVWDPAPLSEAEPSVLAGWQDDPADTYADLEATAELPEPGTSAEWTPAQSGDEDEATALPGEDPMLSAFAEGFADDDLPENLPDSPETLAEALRDDPLPESSTDAADISDQASARPNPGGKAARSRRVTSRIVRIHPDDGDDLPVAVQPPSQPAAPAASDASEDEVARLMRHADDEMSDVENRRRLESLAHLKAAVAATEAERAVTGETIHTPDARLDRYRDDLAQVVQPDDGMADDALTDPADTIPTFDADSGTIRAGAFGPPPLVLVSEQRIDRLPLATGADTPPAAASLSPAQPAPPRATPPAAQPPAAQPPAAQPRSTQPAAPLRTGRLTGMIGVGAALASPVAPDEKLVLPKPSHGAPVEHDDEDDTEEDLTEMDEAGLASFAKRVGVTSMAEMLEAAAAYATCIEKRSQFTRPQLMRRLIASAAGRPVSREDGLRSFGMLLRTGRIEKVGRGHYRLSDTSPYLAEARRQA